MIAGVGIVPSYSGTQSKLVPIQEGISKGELADPAEGILDDTQSAYWLVERKYLACISYALPGRHWDLLVLGPMQSDSTPHESPHFEEC